jgi:hypothetical protein
MSAGRLALTPQPVHLLALRLRAWMPSRTVARHRNLTAVADLVVLQDGYRGMSVDEAQDLRRLSMGLAGRICLSEPAEPHQQGRQVALNTNTSAPLLLHWAKHTLLALSGLTGSRQLLASTQPNMYTVPERSLHTQRGAALGGGGGGVVVVVVVTHCPLEQLWPEEQVTQVAPPVPQVELDCEANGTQVAPLQQPLGQLALVQMHVPLLQV